MYFADSSAVQTLFGIVSVANTRKLYFLAATETSRLRIANLIGQQIAQPLVLQKVRATG
jgi:hypothetical protein